MATQLRVARFSVDVTIPLGHRCMGLLPTKSKEIIDPLQTHGIVLLSDDDPIVIVAVDWCEIRNESYERWREVIAKAVGTEPVRVLLSSLHQHDAPVVDGGAENLLNRAGLVMGGAKSHCLILGAAGWRFGATIGQTACSAGRRSTDP